MGDIPLDTAAVVYTVLEGILYGVSIPLFGFTIRTLWKRKNAHPIVRYCMFTVAIVLLVVSTVHMIIEIIRLEDGLVFYADYGFATPIDYFSDFSSWSFVFLNGIYVFQTLVGDAVVIYRCIVVWQSRAIVAIPVLSWMSAVVTGTGAIVALTNNTGDLFSNQTGPWVTAFFSSTLATNLLGTSLLAYRIWKIDRRVADNRINRSQLSTVLRTILDSAIIYSASLMAALICFVYKSNGQYIMVELTTPIISNVFYMIITRLDSSFRANQTLTSTFRTTRRSHDGTSGIMSPQEHSNASGIEFSNVRLAKLVETSSRDDESVQE